MKHNDISKVILSESEADPISLLRSSDISQNNQIQTSITSNPISKLKPYFYILFACFLLSLNMILIQHITKEFHASPFIIAYLRGLSLTILSVIYILTDYNAYLQNFKLDHIRILIYRGILNAIGIMFFYIAIGYVRVTTGEVMIRCSNLIGAILSYLFLNDKLSLLDVMAIISSFVGTLLVLKPTFMFGDYKTSNEETKSDKPIGIICLTFSMLVAGIGIVVVKKTLDEFKEIFLILSIGLTSFVVGFIIRYLVVYNEIISFNLFVCVFMVSILEFSGHYIQYTALKMTSVVKITPFVSSRILFSVILTMLIQGAGVFDWYDFLGISMILSTYTVIGYKKYKDFEPKKKNILL